MTRGRTRAFIKVQDGCNNTCTYCAIRLARGESRSLGLDRVIDEVNARIDEGFREIVLTGIHLGLYGHDLEPKIKISDLVSEILLKTSLERIRLSSLEINEINDELLSLFDDERLMRHLHIPLQSADNGVLGRMRRGYLAEEFSERLEEISCRLPDAGIGTDIISGFPGESNEAYSNTLEFLNNSRFNYLHVFPYSDRPGTEAALFSDKVHPAIIKGRCAGLRELSTRKKMQFLQSLVGTTQDVLVEERLETGNYSGFTGNYIRAEIQSETDILEDIIRIRVRGADGGTISGIALNNPVTSQ